MAFNGIDISNHQKGLILSRLPKLDVAIFKASQGTGYPDAYFEGFMRQAIDLGIPRTGGYWWVETHQDIKAQLDVYLRKVEPFLNHPGFRMFVDWEPKNPERVGTAVEAVSKLKAATGLQPHIYMNRSTADRYRWQPVRDLGCHLWAAQYPNKDIVRGFKSDPWFQPPSGWDGRIAGLQYTDTGRLPGWDGNLDLNLFWHWPEGGGGGTVKEEPKVEVRVPDIPTLRENDPPVDFADAVGRFYVDSRGNRRKGCVCMALTMPLINAEMLKRGLIKDRIDVFQGGYNAGRVAASAGTHDMGGVIDVAQGITLEHRKVWAMFGVMMFPRTRQYGWTTGDHGHGVWHGCPHQTASADRQVTSGMNGRDGLVGNAVRNFEAPTRTWQEAFREYAAETITITPKGEADPMPEFHPTRTTFNHPGPQTADPDSAYSRIFDSGKGEPEAVPAVPGPALYDTKAQIHAPTGVDIKWRYAWFDEDWHRTMEVITPRTTEGHPTHVDADAKGRCTSELFLDIWASEPCEITVEQQTLYWPI